MQIFRSGDLVQARGERWRVVDARAFDDCQLVTLTGTAASNYGVERRLLVPFDSIAHVQSTAHHRPRLVGRRCWQRVLRQVLSRGLPGDLRAAARARIDLLPHQLQPAVAVLHGLGCRFLLADDVGLGKTIQAGAIVAELQERGSADRVLILTPPGLREQWVDELQQRFHIRPALVDFLAVRDRVSHLRSTVNPWTTWPVVVASVDYIKRPEVLRDVLASPWDVLVVDEAHRVANDGHRHHAVAAIAAHAAYVVLLTATPHNGDAQAFDSLCRIGSHGDSILIFRRTREALSSSAARRVHRLFVRAGPDERRMHARLSDFERAVRSERGDGNRDAWIALAVLRKRAFSSAHALHLSVRRRLVALAPSEAGPAQLLLPLDEHGELDTSDEPPSWDAVLSLRDASLERHLLTALASAAASAAARETKLVAIGRLLRRVAEPVIVFTEYRDTLVQVARSIREPVALLHGGLSRADRHAALRSFVEGERRILLATDAAGEGLNLHQSCRVVINLELPWNPMRLEQRIGRVDRIGQRRTVHAFHLIAAGTGEERLLMELRERIRQAQSEIGAPDPFGDACPLPPNSVPPNLPDVSVEISHLHTRRSFATPAGTLAGYPVDRPLATRARRHPARRMLAGRALFIWELTLEDRCGRPVASDIVGVVGSRTSSHFDLSTLVESSRNKWRANAAEVQRAFVDTRRAREQAIASALSSAPHDLTQPGLFDQRSSQAHAAAEAVRTDVANAIARRLALVESSIATGLIGSRLRFVLLP